MPSRWSRTAIRRVAFAVLLVGCAAGAIGYAVRTSTRARSAAALDTTAVIAEPSAVAAAAGRPHLLFRSTARGDTAGKLCLVPLDALNGTRYVTGLSCERVHFAAGKGLCLAADRGAMTYYHADLFDAHFQPRQKLPFSGMPSRARVSPDGGLAALTFFVTGDSYSAAGFSTRTVVLDASSGEPFGDLEQFAVSRAGIPFKALDFNFWGVTFAGEPGRFYATLASGGQTYLIEGDTRTRTAGILRENVECPALSPDNRRVAFKRRMPGARPVWRLRVLDLESSTETELAESRSVDDQVEWLDGRQVLYALPNDPMVPGAATNVWTVPADGSGAPRLVLPNAESPVAVRPSGAVRVTSASR